MPAAIPEAERPDELPVKTIQTTINSKITPAVSVRTLAPLDAIPCARERAAPTLPLYSPATLADSSIAFRTKPIHHLSHVQVNDAPQSAPAGQGQLASAQQARRLGPPWPTYSPIPRRERRTRVWCTRTVIAPPASPLHANHPPLPVPPTVRCGALR